MLTVMNKCMLEKIRLLDNVCFNRGDNYRSIGNLTELSSNNPDGCFVIMHEDEIAGYIFSRKLGSVGFIGPLGVKPALQGKSFGKTIIQASCDTLIKVGCKSIGLEVLPERGNNIGLYQKMGFIPTFSTITYRKKTNYEPTKCDKVVNGKDADINTILSFDRAFSNEHNGYSLFKDIESAISHKDSSIFFYEEKRILVGFLCYSPLTNPFVWGAFLRDYSQKKIFEILFSYIEKSNQDKKLKIRINSRYKKTLSIIDNSFEVERSILRMMLTDYEGEYMLMDNKSFVASSWVG